MPHLRDAFYALNLAHSAPKLKKENDILYILSKQL